MLTPAKSFSMRKGGKPPQGDWFSIKNQADDVTEVMIYDEIGFWGTTADDFVKQLKNISSPKIHLRVNSPGGAVFDGVAIYNALIRHEAEVTVFVDALAASAASFITQAGDKVIMAKGSTMMIHDGLAICMGNEDDMLHTARTLSKISNNIASIYADRAGGSVEDWRAVMKEEVWFTADEAVIANLADEVLSSQDEHAQEETNKWDLSVYNYAGREEAPNPSYTLERIEVANRKEPSMSGRPKSTTVKNDGQSTESTESTQSTEGTESTKSTEGAAGSESTDTETPPTGQAGAQGFMIGGQMVTDPTQVQAAITAFETSQQESRRANVREFVESLSNDGKILASAVDDLVNLAMTFTPEQYKTWSASYGSAPAMPVLGKMGTGAEQHANQDTSTSQVDAEKDQVEVWRATVAMHERSGMAQEKIERTESWKNLQAWEAKNNQS